MISDLLPNVKKGVIIYVSFSITQTGPLLRENTNRIKLKNGKGHIQVRKDLGVTGQEVNPRNYDLFKIPPRVTDCTNSSPSLLDFYHLF